MSLFLRHKSLLCLRESLFAVLCLQVVVSDNFFTIEHRFLDSRDCLPVFLDVMVAKLRDVPLFCLLQEVPLLLSFLASQHLVVVVFA